MTRRRDGETARRKGGRKKGSGSGEVGIARNLGTVWESGARHSIDPSLVEIRPEPSPAERAAILIALEQVLAATPNDAPAATAWSVAGRRESRPAGPGGVGTGWGRGLDRLTGW